MTARILWHPLLLLLLSVHECEDSTLNTVSFSFLWTSERKQYISDEVSSLLAQNLIGSNCLSAINQTLTGFFSGEDWAYQMLDAAGKWPSDLHDGAWAWLGSYSECMNIQVKNSFNGLYCLAFINSSDHGIDPYDPRIDIQFFRYGFCAPDICKSEEIQNLTVAVLKLLPVPDFKNSTSKVICQQRELEWSDGAIVVLSICGIFVFLVIVGTLYDLCIYQPYHNSSRTIFRSIKISSSAEEENDETKPLLFTPKPMGGSIVDKNPSIRPNIIARICLSFSLNINVGKILNTQQKEDSLDCIHGVKVLSMFWLILGHSYLYSFNIFSNPKVIEPVIKSLIFQAVLSSHVAVDSFFLVSGTLVCYLLLKDARKKDGYVNWIAFYFHRFWRLTPTYMLILGLYVNLFRYVGTGPLWPQNGVDTDNCVHTWWTNLLYVNNFVNSTNMCMRWSWYLANDMQFHVISPIILVALLKLEYLGICLITFFLTATCLTSGLISSINRFHPGILTGNTYHPIDLHGKQYDEMLIQPYCRIGPYLVGLLLGYILFKYEHRPVLRSKFLLLFCWLAALVCNVFVVYGLYSVAQGHEISNDISALYNSLYHTAWALSLAWLIFACIKGYGGIINEFLSWKIWFALSKLSYCVYLVHPMVIIAYYQSRQNLDTFTHFVVIYYFLANTILSYGIAFVLSLVFEAPLISLERIVLKKDEWRS